MLIIERDGKGKRQKGDGKLNYASNSCCVIPIWNSIFMSFATMDSTNYTWRIFEEKLHLQ